jgi:hypothetical protein
MKERRALLRGLKVFDEGSLLDRLKAVRDAYAYTCADALATGREDKAIEYAQVFMYCEKLVKAYRKRWEERNMKEGK